MLNRTNIIEKLLNKKNKLEPISDCYIPTPYECAALSYDTYKYEKAYYDTVPYWKEKEGYPPLPAGWKRYAISKPTHIDHDYCGVVYIKWDPNPVAFVFANRGTVPTYGTNLYACLEILKQNQTSHALLGRKFLFNTLEHIEYDSDLEPYRDDLELCSLTFTGHSLGGHTADHQFYEICLFPNAHSITFDNPGSYEAIYNKIMATKDPEKREEGILIFNKCAIKSFNYVAHANFINTCNRHWGNVFVLKDLPFIYDIQGFTPTVDIDSNIVKNFYYVLYTLNQHEMVNIYSYLKNGGTFALDLNHVNGVKNAFIDYLWVEKHSTYWNGYIDYIWTNNESFRDQYENNRLKFFESMYDIIQAAQKEASQFASLQLQENVKDNINLNNSQLTASKLGLFGKQEAEIAKDFVFVSRDNPSIDTQDQYKKKGWSIL